ncbi:MAG: tRNA lysidine(34) synthetase TilS [Anaerovoracaceae bacterium]|nr:tRNA lysidine(34) synthetase TilS [Anaerovoracaceae bacterium]
MKVDIEKRIRETVQGHGLINENEHVILGLSGGPDSMCLFDVLTALAPKIGFTLEAVHVNHKIRPGAAEEDQAYVENVCAGRGIACTVVTERCEERAAEWGLTSEEAGRRIRYGAFDDAAAAYAGSHPGCPAVKIATAHNMNDQAETVLLRILRGTGVDGLAGIDYFRGTPAGFTVIRPLLDCAREDIEAYCSERGLEPRNDKTNSEPLYTRNKIRLGLIPYLRENFNENIIETLARLASSARSDSECLTAAAEAAYDITVTDSADGSLAFGREYLKEMKPAVRRRVIMTAMKRLGLTRDMTAAHITAAERLIESENASGTAEFTGGYSVSVSYDTVIVSAPDGAPRHEEKISLSIDIVPACEYDGGRGEAAFDYDMLIRGAGTGEIELRTRMPGDRISLPGMDGHKKIQDLFVDMKIPVSERDRIPLICAGHEVLYIAGDPASGRKPRYSGNYRVSGSTERVAVLEFCT